MASLRVPPSPPPPPTPHPRLCTVTPGAYSIQLVVRPSPPTAGLFLCRVELNHSSFRFSLALGLCKAHGPAAFSSHPRPLSLSLPPPSESSSSFMALEAGLTAIRKRSSRAMVCCRSTMIHIVSNWRSGNIRSKGGWRAQDGDHARVF